MTESSQIDVASQFADDDPVGRLIVHYFYPADLMREHHREAIRDLDPKARPATWRDGAAVSYWRLWFASLYVVVEGYGELKLRHDAVEPLLSRTDYVQALKLFRNGTFHYRKTPDKLLQLIDYDDGEVMKWADRLHLALGACLSDYRVQMTVRNILAMPDADP